MEKPDRLQLPQTPIGQIMKGDPLAMSLWRFQISPLVWLLVSLIYALIYALVIPALFGSLPQVLSDWPSLVIIFVAGPLVSGYYAWQPVTIQRVFMGLSQRVREAEYKDEQIARLTMSLRWPGWFWLAVLVGVLQSFYLIISLISAPAGWQNSPQLMVYVLVPLRFLVFYEIVFIVIRQAVVIYAINQFLKIFQVEIAPMHPDKAGGLRMLGNYVLSTGLLLGVIGLVFGMRLLRVWQGLEVFTVELAELVIYITAGPAMFLLPLWTAHQRMLSAKQEILQRIAEEFESHFYIALDNLNSKKFSGDDLDRISAYQRMYDIAEKAPIWPIDMNLVSQFFAAVVLPVVMPISMNWLTEIVSRLFILK